MILVSESIDLVLTGEWPIVGVPQSCGYYMSGELTIFSIMFSSGSTPSSDNQNLIFIRF